MFVLRVLLVLGSSVLPILPVFAVFGPSVLLVLPALALFTGGRQYCTTLSSQSTKCTRYSEYTRSITYNGRICGVLLYCIIYRSFVSLDLPGLLEGQ